MIDNYQGMKWLKCDLQVQTPADAKHWTGEKLIKGEEHLSAEKFAEACYELKLDVVGITEHNFLSKDFIPFLKEAFNNIYTKYQHQITLLLGFEFEAAGVGKGVHILCLFDSDTEIDKVDSVLTECGVGVPRIENGQLKKSDRNLKEIIRIVQDSHKGIVILPHATSNDGLFDNEKISDWVQQDQFINPSLLAIEIPRPIERMSKGYQKLILATDDCHPDWKRIRPIATLMSSDNKTLIDKDSEGNHKPNSLGYRYSWIKMSKPSIESLRQAFLDHSSRIKLPDDVNNDVHPETISENNIIKSISVRNVKFLEDQDVHFSPSFNCIIGGRGSGKSTLIEYLRTAFKRDNLEKSTKASEKVERVKSTLNSTGAKIEVHWQSNQLNQDTIVWQNDTGASVISRTVVDNDKYFNDLPVSFYSQQQLNDLSASVVVNDGNRQAGGLLDLLNSLIRDDLSRLHEREVEIKLEIDATYVQHRNLIKMRSIQQNLEHDFNELDLKWKARKDIQEDATLHELLTAEKNHLNAVWDEFISNKKVLEESLDRFSSTKTVALLKETPNNEWIKIFEKKVELATQELVDNVRKELIQCNDKIVEITQSDAGQEVVGQLRKANEEFESACRERGMSIDDVANLSALNTDRISKRELLHEKNQQIKEAETNAKDIEKLLRDLHKVWNDQYELRSNLAKLKSDEMKEDKTENSMIEVSVLKQQDYRSFEKHWKEFSPSDARTRLGKNWTKIGETIYASYISSDNSTASSPWDLLNDLIDENAEKVNLNLNIEVDVDTKKRDIKEELYQYITSNPDQWLNLRCQRVLDSVDIELFRHDGKSAGSISDNNLSDGQRNTAVLALLLSQDGGPLIIDQPEDELDSNFVYKELIPLLRNMKHKRQLIIATHNANLPVNGDAEMVYAFDVENGRGVMKACGGLDNPEVTRAILDIMEGTEEAFRRRREKYSF